MTVKEQIDNLSIEQYSNFLNNFAIAFYCESLSGVCEIECFESKDSCPGCLKSWLESERDISGLISKK